MPDQQLDSLRTAANESSRAAHRVHLTFLGVVAYVALTVWSTTHEDLLRGSLVTLPLLRVGVPIWSFYLVTPWLLIVLHFNLLLCLTLLSSKLFAVEHRIRLLPDAETQQAQVHLLDDFTFTHYLVGKRYSRTMSWRDCLALAVTSAQLSCWVWATVWALPPVLLLCVQMRFLPYHDETVSHWQQAALSADLVLLWIFWLMLSRRQINSRRSIYARWARHLPKPGALVAAGAVICASAGLLLTSFVALAVPGKQSEPRWWYRAPELARRAAPRNIDVTEATLVREAPPPEVLAAYYQKGESGEAAWRDYAKGLDLRRRDLRFGKFTRANLTNADLRGANLEGAELGEARLSGARLTVGEAEHGAYYISDARLRGAQLWLLKLPDAFLHGAQLEFVYAHEAQLPGADMRRANLLGAWTRVMDLRGADLRDARLQGVDSFAVDLRGADLRRAQLQGADLGFARLQGADLRDARLQGANLTGAKLDAADLRGASLWNARFKDASLRLADLRGIKMDALSEESRGELIEEGKRLQEQLDYRISFWVGSLEERLRAAFKEGQGSISTDASIHDDAAYGRGAFADWGEPFELDDYRRKVAAYLSELACDDAYVARGILCERRTPGDQRLPEYVPRTSYVPGMMDPRTADVFSAVRNHDCLGLRQLPPDTLESLRTWKAPPD